MVHPLPRIAVLSFALLAGGTAQAQNVGPAESREPPLAGTEDVTPAKGGSDTDDPPGVKQAEHRVPAAPPPSLLPAPILSPTGDLLPAAFTEGPGSAGDLPTPVVTLNVEGSEISPSGQPVIYKLTVRNVSRAKAHNIVVRLIPPKNAERVKWEPVPTHDDAEARWEIKSLEPGQTRTIEVSYRPNADTDDVEIKARVQFDFGRGMKTHVSPPSLSVKKEGPERVVLGDVATYRIVVKNTGRVTVRDIDVTERLDKGLIYEDKELARGTIDGRLMSTIDPKSGERMWAIPTLAPGQSQVIEYRVRAKEAKKVGSLVFLKAPNLPPKQAEFETDVRTAALQLKAEGPGGEKGTVGQPAGYRVVVQNVGTAELRNVCVRCLLPPDMRPTRATNGGQPFRDHVQWIFEKLQPGDSKELNVALATASPGTRTVQFVVKADKGPEQRTAVKTDFAGKPAIDWDTEVPGTAAVGKTFFYRVTVYNRGSATGGAKVTVDLPDNVELVGTTPAASKGVGQNAKMVIFPAIDIPPLKKTTFTVEVKARSAGDARAVFHLGGDGVGSADSEHRKSTSIFGTDDRNKGGPPPRKEGDATRVGSSPDG